MLSISGCEKETTYSIDQLTIDRELSGKVYARCSAGELSMESESCKNATQVERAHQLKESFGQ